MQSVLHTGYEPIKVGATDAAGVKQSSHITALLREKAGISLAQTDFQFRRTVIQAVVETAGGDDAPGSTSADTNRCRASNFG